MDGGNLMFDGSGNLFTTKVTYVWNKHLTRQEVNQELKVVFGVDQIHAFDYAKNAANSDRAADGTGHLDMFVKILAPCVVLVAEARPSDHAYWAVLNKAATYFSTLHCQTHHDMDKSSITSTFYQVFRVPGWEDRQRWYTYTNSLIVNDRVVVPSYDSAADNDIALAVYNTAVPQLTVDFVHSEIAIQQGGAIHCLTRDVPRLPRPVGNATRASLRQKRARQKIFHGTGN
jgi:agmatine deiminase